MSRKVICDVVGVPSRQGSTYRTDLESERVRDDKSEKTYRVYRQDRSAGISNLTRDY